jgi:hypothetical protein
MHRMHAVLLLLAGASSQRDSAGYPAERVSD